METSEAISRVLKAVAAGTLANGYLVCGDVRGNCAEFTEAVLMKLFEDEREQVAAKSHPDIAYLEPEGKSRTIKTEAMRERIVEPMSVTAFSGGWKAGVIAGADRMQPSAANSFLKTLEEPTPKTVFFLLTDAPDAVMPTIVSRTQRIDLKLPSGLLEDDSYAAVAEVMASAIAGTYGKMRAAARLGEIIAELKDAAEDEDVAFVKKSFYKTVMSFVRGWMVRGELPYHQAFRNVDAVEEAYRRSEKAISDDAVLAYMMDRLVFPGRI